MCGCLNDDLMLFNSDEINVISYKFADNMKNDSRPELMQISRVKNIPLSRIEVKNIYTPNEKSVNLSEQYRFSPYDTFMKSEDRQGSRSNKYCVVIDDRKYQQVKNLGITHGDIKISKNFNNLNARLPSHRKHRVSLTIGSEKAEKIIRDNMTRQRRAKQFINLITKEKNRHKGQFFMLKQAEQERRRLKTEFETCEKKILMDRYKQQRVKAAIEKIKMLQKKAQEREKVSRLSHSYEYIVDQSIKLSKKDKTRLVLCKQKKFSKYLARSSNRNEKRYKNGNQLKNLVYLDDGQQQAVEQTRRKLVELSMIMDKKQKLISHYF